MERSYTKTTCPLHATPYCENLNMESCEACTVKCETQAQADAVKADLDACAALLPEGGVSALFATDECRFCKTQPKGKKSWYAFLDLANPEPRRVKANVLGLARHPRAGTLLPVQISCCEACRKRFLRVEYATPVLAALSAVLPLAVMSVRSVREPLMAVNHGLPFYIFAACILLGVCAGHFLKKALLKKYAPLTHMKAMEIPLLAQMKENGWFELNGEGPASKLVFAKKPAGRGLYTAMPREAGEAGQNARPGCEANGQPGGEPPTL